MDIVTQTIRGGLSVKEALQQINKQLIERMHQNLTRNSRKIGDMTVAAIRPVPKKDVADL